MLQEKSFGLCLVGCGFIGSIHSEMWKNIPEARLISCVDMEKGKSEEFAKVHGFKQGTNDLQTALHDERIQIVDICTPTYTHRDVAVLSAEAGKNILVEKPLALRLRDAREIVSTADKNCIKLMVAHVVRFISEYATVKKLVSDGAIGEPVIARAYRQSGFPKWVSQNWHDCVNKGGGVFVDLSIHDLDFLRWTIGEVSEVYAQGGTFLRKAASSHDYTHAIINFKNGAVAYVEGSWIMPDMYPFTTYLEIAGTGGILHVDNNSTASLVEYTHEKSKGSTPTEQKGYYLEIREFMNCLVEDSASPVPGDEGYKSLELALAGLKSVMTGSPVSLPLRGEVIE